MGVVSQTQGLLPYGGDSAKFDKNAILHHSIELIKSLLDQLRMEDENGAKVRKQACRCPLRLLDCVWGVCGGGRAWLLRSQLYSRKGRCTLEGMRVAFAALKPLVRAADGGGRPKHGRIPVLF